MKGNNRNNTSSKKGAVLCKLAEKVAPQVSEKCMGMYYQPVKPESMKDFVDMHNKKENLTK